MDKEVQTSLVAKRTPWPAGLRSVEEHRKKEEAVAVHLSARWARLFRREPSRHCTGAEFVASCLCFCVFYRLLRLSTADWCQERSAPSPGG